MGDVNFVTKFLLANESEDLPALALKTVLKSTTGDAGRGLGSGALDYTVVGVASKQVGDCILHSMFGYTFIGTNGDQNMRDILLYGIAADFGLTETMHVVAEFTGNRHPDRQVDTYPHTVMIGATYMLSDEVTLDASTRFGTNSTAADWNTSVGLTVSL